MQPQCARAVLVLALALALAAPQAGAQMIVADITDVTFGSTVTFTITVPVGGPFGATDQVGVVAAGAACANTVPAGVTLQSPAPVTSAASATAVATFDTPGDYLFCYIQGGVGAGVNLAVQVRGADQLMNAQVHPIETFAAMGLQDLAITGTGLVTGMDQVKLVAENANCDDATVLGPAALEAGMAGATVFQVQNLPFGGTFTVCYQVASATNPSEFRNIGTVDAIAPGGYSPRRVSMGNIAINFAGSAGFLTAGMDQAFITTSAMTCDPANAVVGPVTVTDPNHAVFDTQLSGTLDTPGVAYKVCYQVVALAGNAADYFALREELSVTGATDYNPKAAPGAGDITLTFTGVLLDSTNVGDSMKIVDGDDCLADAAIVEGGIPGTAPWVPANARDPPPPELAITVNIPKSGRFLVCFKSSTSGEYHPMATAGAPDRLVVNGAADYSPTIVPVGHTGDLTFSGVAFDAGDRVAVVHENVGSCTSAQAVSLTWTRQSATRGVAEISNPATLATLGNYRVCFTPTGGSVYEMPTPLVVSTQSISPTEYIAGVETQAVHSTNGIASDPNDEIKFIDEGRGETCGLGFPTHGTIVKQAGFDGRYMVTFDYGGIFRLCHRPGSAAEFGPAADVLVRGARAVSPFLPIVAAVGIPTAFELEGWGLSTLDSFEVIDDSAAPGDCGGDVKLSPQLMHEVVGQESLITTAAATFNIGGSFLVCYRVAGGPPLALDTRLTVKGPNLVTPPAPWNFRVEATLLITGRELSADPATGDRVKLITGTQTCADADAPSPAIASVSAPDPTTNEVTATIPVNTDQGGVYRVCYKPYEGGYVLLPGEHTVNGPVTMTPDTMYANPTRNTVVAITGEGLNPADLIKIIAQGGDCATAPDLFGSQQAVANPAAVPFTLDAAGEYEVCYQLITAMPMVFQRWQQIQVFGVAAVSPTAVDVGYDVQIVIRGTGLNPVTDRVELMPTMTCPVAAPTDGPNLRGDSNTVVHTTALLAGSAATYICYYANNEWTMHATPLVVNGPHTRTMTQPTTPLIAGAPLQFTVAGVGLSGGADAVRWVRRQVTAGAVSPEVCNNPVVPDATVAADSTTPTVQLPGGTYVMCYRLGTSSVFIPVGDPMGGAPGGIQGEVALAGPSGFWTAAGAAFATAQEALLSFDNLVDGAEYKVALCRDGSTSDLTLLSGADPATPVTEVAFTGGAAALYPLQGGTTQVCFKVEGSEWTPLPRIAALPGDRNADLTRPLDPAGEVTIAGPAGVQLPLIDGLQLSLIPAGRAVVFPLVPGAELSTNQSSVWWAPTSEGCTSATFNPTNHSLATTLLINATTLQTVFHAAGEYALCYSARPDAAQVVAQHHLLTVTVHGLSQAASTTVNFGQVAPAELALPRVGGNPPREVFLLPQASAAAPPGARSCNVFDATANTNNPPADAVRAPVLRVAAAAATYDVAAAPPGYHVVCLQQDTAGYATLPELLVVRGPVTLEPDAVIAPGSFRMQLSGPGITDNDMVRMGELSTNQSSVWWAPTSEGCTSATFNPTNHSLATTLLINATTLQTVFHAAGEYALCYSARPDAAQVVAQHHLLTVTVHGLSQAASTTVNFGQVAPAELALPRVGGNPPREVFLLPQASAAAPPGARSCNVFDATANTNNPPADAVRAPVLRVAAAAATYDVAAAPPGYHVVCLQQDTAGYATLPELLVVRGPVTLEPDAVIAPGSFRMQLSGPGITDNDMVRMGELVDGVAPDCANAPHEFSLRNLVFIGARYDVPAEHFVCYELNFPGEPKGTLKWVQPIVFRVTDKPATALFRAGVPTEVESGAPFRVEVELHDQFGNVVGGQDAGTFSISADNSPGLPISLDADGLTQPCVDGTAGFTLKLDTQGVHRLLVTFTDSNTGVVLTALSNEIDVKPGSPSKLAISIMPGSELVSGEEFVVSYHVVDQGFNPIGLTGVTTTVRLAPLDESARAGTLTGTTTSVTDMFGNGAFIDLKINTIGAYRLLVSGVPTDGSGPYTADLDVVVVPGDGAALVIDSQWGDGFAIYAGASLPTLEVHAEDVGQNKLYVGRPTPFFISLAVDALAVLPEGAALYDTDPSVCIQTACTEMVDGRTSYLGTVRFSGVWVNRPGTYRLTVTSPTLTAVTNTFVVAQGPASHVRVTNGAQRAVRPGEIFEVSAGIVDLGGNLVQSDGQIQATDYSASGALSGRLTELVDPATLLASFSLNYTEPGTFTVAFKHSRLSLVQAKVAVVVATDGFTLPPEPAAAEDDGLGTWAIVLIVIGVLLFLILVAVLVMWCRGKEREEEDLGKEPAGAQPDWEEDAQQNPNARYYGGYPDHAEPQNPLGELDHYDGMPPQYTNPYDSMRRNGNARIMTPADPMHQLAAPPQQPARVVEEFMDAPAAQHSPGTPPGPGGYPSMGAGGGGGMAYNDPAVGSPSYNVVPAASPQTQSGVAYSHTGGGYYSGAGQYAA
eukprot:TRINITY_DN9445_c3_g1_i1.p1 TRINITY_DN9445_c3_g1~~TRINITY_DN9445_c3_g1_i1.p1  ORF type:complete len:2451 (+),score=846.16 TRINITY_DN9445_c3_g1_i1:99-7451(+)